jgi:hypothetical protein
MKRLLAIVLCMSALSAGCRSVPIAVPNLPAEQFLVNQPTFEHAVNQRILGNCEKGRIPGTFSQYELLGRSVLCGTKRIESGIR